MCLENDLDLTVRRYSDRFKIHGLSPKTLGWDKGKQDIRYKNLVQDFCLDGVSILDLGCGFGDANKVLSLRSKDYKYTGIDIVPELVRKAKEIYANDKDLNFILGDFLDFNFDISFDIVLASGVFNHRFDYSDNYDFIEKCMQKAFYLADVGISFDFLSDRVDFKKNHTFHSSPLKILKIAYSLSRNVVLRNNYMPFEFSITIMKDDSFDKKDTVFNTCKNIMGFSS